MSDVPGPSEFPMTPDEMWRLIQRDAFVKAEMASRIGSLVAENIGLMSVVQELQRDLAEARQVLVELEASANGEHPDPVEVLS